MQFFLGKVVVITGAGSGIGKALAYALVKQGSHVVLSDIDQGSLNALQTDLAKLDNPQTGSIKIFAADVSDYENMQAFSSFVGTEFGRLDILINNAGVGLGALFQDCDLKDMRDLFDINFWGVVYGCQLFLPLLQRAERGHIVNISSVLGLLSGPRVSAYSSSKFAIRGFSDSLRHDLRLSENQINVSCVFPSGIKTNILANSKIIVPIGSNTSSDTERERLEPWFWTEPSQAAREILNSVMKGKTRIHVGKGARFLDFVSRFFPVSYTRFLPKSLLE